MNKPFISSNYALMRHAQYRGMGTQTSLVPASVEICRQVISDLAQRIPGKDVRVLHSPLLRAELTAEVVARKFSELGISAIERGPRAFLRNDGREINNENIKKDLDGFGDNVFTLFISHLCDIGYYLGDSNMDIYNCAIYSGEFTIIIKPET